MITVLIVDDSPTTRLFLKEMLERDPALKVIATAADGEEALAQVVRMPPQVVVMDIHMPKMNGYQATEKIMATYAVPIIIMSADARLVDVTNAFKAIDAGALAVLEKPNGPGHPESPRMLGKLIETIKVMSEVKVVNRFPLRKRAIRHSLQPSSQPIAISQRAYNAVAIGASTGGPPTLKTLLQGLGPDFPLPILVVQHISPGFLEGMVHWMQKEIHQHITIPTHQETLTRGKVYFAPDGWHMGISAQGRIQLRDTPPLNGLRPAVDHLFESMGRHLGPAGIGILLTGMGRDGAKGLKTMYAKGALTIAQDQETSIVYGMPAEAKRMGAASLILSPLEMIDCLKNLTKSHIHDEM